MASRILLVIILLVLSGCARMHANTRHAYTTGYQATVKAEVAEISKEFSDGNFPSYHWNTPIVQDVMVPASIQNGVFIPQHQELVLIKPGHWVKEQGYPILQTKEKYATSQENHVFNDVSDITSVPDNLGITRDHHE